MHELTRLEDEVKGMFLFYSSLARGMRKAIEPDDSSALSCVCNVVDNFQFMPCRVRTGRLESEEGWNIKTVTDYYLTNYLHSLHNGNSEELYRGNDICGEGVPNLHYMAKNTR